MACRRIVTLNMPTPISKGIPLPKILNILGGPSKALNMMVIRPFSLMLAIVSTPDQIYKFDKLQHAQEKAKTYRSQSNPRTILELN